MVHLANAHLMSLNWWCWRWGQSCLGRLYLVVRGNNGELRSISRWRWRWERRCMNGLHWKVHAVNAGLRSIGRQWNCCPRQMHCACRRHQARRLEIDLRSLDRNEWRRVGPCLPAPVTVMGTELKPRVGTTVVCNPAFFIARLRTTCVGAAELISINRECRVAISRGARRGARPTEKEKSRTATRLQKAR